MGFRSNLDYPLPCPLGPHGWCFVYRAPYDLFGLRCRACTPVLGMRAAPLGIRLLYARHTLSTHRHTCCSARYTLVIRSTYAQHSLGIRLLYARHTLSIRLAYACCTLDIRAALLRCASDPAARPRAQLWRRCRDVGGCYCPCVPQRVGLPLPSDVLTLPQ